MNAPWFRDDEITYFLLLMCGGHSVPREAVTGWTDEQCRQAEEWARHPHQRRVPMPPHVAAYPPKPWWSAGGLWD